MLGGFSLKAWLFSCFCLITGHKVRSASLAGVQQSHSCYKNAQTYQIASWLCPVKWLIFYLVNHIFLLLFFLFKLSQCHLYSRKALSNKFT